MDPQYAQFMSVVGALGKLVVLSLILERALAFVFEHDWFKMTSRVTVPDPQDPTRTISDSRWPGLKGFLALGAAISICYGYNFNVMSALFGTTRPDLVGILITGVVAAGGSAGAIAIFQGFLNMNKDSRDALIAAKKSEAEAARDNAEALAREAAAKKVAAEAMHLQAELMKQTASAGLRVEVTAPGQPVATPHVAAAGAGR
jgi:hypothetical protein